ncbi:MAG: hypothetical protein V3U74_07935 [Thermodesulfobacteriota bacterium]
MERRGFSKGEAVRFGWDTMKSNLGFLIVIMILYMLIPALTEIMTSVFIIIPFFVECALFMGFIRINLGFVDNRRPKLGELFSCFGPLLLLKYIVASFLYMLIVIAGLILLIVPGIIWAIKFSFYPYFLVDKGLGIIDSLKKSAEITDGVKLDLFVLSVLLGLIILLGALVFPIVLLVAIPTTNFEVHDYLLYIAGFTGLLVTIPTTMLALAFVYRRLLEQVEGSPNARRPERSRAPTLRRPAPIEPKSR